MTQANEPASDAGALPEWPKDLGGSDDYGAWYWQCMANALRARLEMALDLLESHRQVIAEGPECPAKTIVLAYHRQVTEACKEPK